MPFPAVRSRFAKNLLTLASGTAAAQALQLLFMPVLTRLYTPVEFGLFAVFLGITVPIATAACGRYEVAIPLPREEGDATALVRLALGLLLATTGVFLLAILLFRRELAGALNAEAIADVLLLAPLAVAFVAGNSLLTYLLTRRRRFAALASARILAAATFLSAAILYGWFRPGAEGLVIGRLVGDLIGVGALLFVAIRIGAASGPPARLGPVARRHSGFPLFDLPNSLLHSYSTHGIVMMLNACFRSAATGFFVLANQVLLKPFGVFLGSFTQVFYEKMSRARAEDPGALGPLVVRAMRQFILWFTLPFLVLAATSRWYAGWIFGADWAGLYRYIYVLAPFVYLSVISNPIGNVLRVVEKQHVSLALRAVTISAQVLGILAGYLMGGEVLHSVLGYSVASTAALLLSLSVILRLAGVRAAGLVAALGVVLAGAFAVAWLAAA